MSRAAEWVQDNVNALAKYSKGKIEPIELNEFQRSAVELLAEGFGCGIYNVQVNWKTVDWYAGSGIRFTIWASGGLSTYDYSTLTRLVIGAHDRCIRLDISPAARAYIYLYMHPRQRDGASMSQRHPTIEQAIETFRTGAKS